jgi:hypothetical protein
MLKKSFSSKIVNKSFCVIPSFENCVVTLMVFFFVGSICNSLSWRKKFNEGSFLFQTC